MKKVMIVSALLLFAVSVSAQTFMFYLGDNPLEDNAELTVWDYELFFTEGDMTVLTIESNLRLKNVGATDAQADVTQTITSAPLDGDSGYLSFCLFDCITGNYDRVKSDLFKANSFHVGFHVNFYVQAGKYNRITVRYEVTSGTGNKEKRTVTVTYLYNENSGPVSNKPVFKPSFKVIQEGSRVKLDYAEYTQSSRLEIYSLTGQKIAQYALPANSGSFLLSENLTKGIYFFVLKNEKQITTTQKFIVK